MIFRTKVIFKTKHWQTKYGFTSIANSQGTISVFVQDCSHNKILNHSDQLSQDRNDRDLDFKSKKIQINKRAEHKYNVYYNIK